MHRNNMKWTDVDFVFQRIQIWLSSVLYFISFAISVYLYFNVNCSDILYLESAITSVIAFIVPLYVYGCLKPKEEDPMCKDTLSAYKLGKMVHVVAAVVATLYHAMALAESIHIKEICPSYNDTDTNWIVTYSIINTIAYNGVTFLGHSMMRKPKAKQDTPAVAYKVESESGTFRSDLQRRNSVRF